LLDVLKPRCPELPNDARTLLQMDEGEVEMGVKLPVKAVSIGHYYHFRISAEILPSA
jgi:hypothetical protein